MTEEQLFEALRRNDLVSLKGVWDELQTARELVKTMEDNAQLLQDQLDVAIDRAQSWKNLHDRLREENRVLRQQNNAHVERIAAQSVLLSEYAERTPLVLTEVP
jgi:hypothetical protein